MSEWTLTLNAAYPEDADSPETGPSAFLVELRRSGRLIAEARPVPATDLPLFQQMVSTLNAAPELLAALERLEAAVTLDEQFAAHAQARTAIAKARGEDS